MNGQILDSEVASRHSPSPAYPPFPTVNARPFHSSGNHTSVFAVEPAVSFVVITSSSLQKAGRELVMRELSDALREMLAFSA